MSKATRQLVLALFIFAGLFILISNLDVMAIIVTQVARWVWTNREGVSIDLAAILIWAVLGALLLLFRRQLWELLQRFFLNREVKQKREEREYDERLYLANIAAKIREEEPKWDTQFYTPLSATETYRLPGCQPEMILVSRRLRPKLFLPAEEEEDTNLSPIRGRKVDLIGILRKRERLVVLGAPGSGKSVAIRQLALLAAEEAKRESVARRRLPLLVNTRSYTALSPDGKPQDVVIFLRQYISDNLPRYGDFLAHALECYLAEGKLLILFDGLNEMPSADYTERLKALKDFSVTWPRTKVIFTCRTFHHDPLFNIQEVVINPLTTRKIELFIKNYLGSREGMRLYKELRAWDKRVLFKDCRTPYFLAMIIVLFNAGVPLPKTRAELFSAFVFGMVERMAKTKGIDPQSAYSDIAENLRRLAFRMNEAKLLGTEIDRRWAIKAIRDKAATRTLELAASAGLLDVTHAGKIRFAHHILQEYFACLTLSDKFAEAQDISGYLQDPWWEETVTLMAGLVQEPSGLINNYILANEPRTSWDVWLAARCLAASGIVEDSPAYAVIRNAIDSELSTNNFFRIARAIRALGELGDEQSIRLAAQWLYSRHPWLQETALSSVVSSSTPAAREEIARFFRTRAPWTRILPFLQYHLAFEERGPILRVLLLRIVVILGFYAGIWILFGAAVEFASTATRKPVFSTVPNTLALLVLFVLLAYFAPWLQIVIQGIFGLSWWFSLAFLTALVVSVLVFAYQFLRGFCELGDALIFFGLAWLCAYVTWLVQQGIKASRIMLKTRRRRHDYQKSLAFSLAGLVLTLHLAISIPLLAFMLNHLLVTKRYVLDNVVFVATGPSFPPASRLVIGGTLLLAIALLVIPMPAGVLATLAHTINLRKVFHLHRLEKALSVPDRIVGDELKRGVSSLEQLIRSRHTHDIIRSRSIMLLARVVPPVEVLPVIIRLLLDDSTPLAVHSSACKAVDEIDNRWSRQPTDRSGEAKLVDALLTFAIAARDLAEGAKATILEWAETANMHSADPHIIAAALLKADGNPKGAADMLSRALSAEPDDMSMYWQRADALLAAGDYVPALVDLAKYISAMDIKSLEWGPTLFDEFISALRLPVFRRLHQIETHIKVPPVIEQWIDNQLVAALVGRSCRDDDGLWIASLEYNSEAIQHWPHKAFLYRNRAQTHIRLSHFEEAACDLSKAAELDPDHPMLRYRYWQFHQYQGQTEKALWSLLRAIRSYPTLDNWYFALGTSLLALGNSEGALQAFRLGTMFRPDRDEIGSARRRLNRVIPKGVNGEALDQIEAILRTAEQRLL